MSNRTGGLLGELGWLHSACPTAVQLSKPGPLGGVGDSVSVLILIFSPGNFSSIA